MKSMKSPWKTPMSFPIKSQRPWEPLGTPDPVATRGRRGLGANDFARLRGVLDVQESISHLVRSWVLWRLFIRVLWGFHGDLGDTPIAGWFIRGNPIKTWMIFLVGSLWG